MKDEEIRLDEACKQAQKEAAELKQRRWAATVNLVDAVLLTDREAESAGDHIRLFDPAVEALKGNPPITSERLRRAAGFLSALADLRDERNGFADATNRGSRPAQPMSTQPTG